MPHLSGIMYTFVQMRRNQFSASCYISCYNFYVLAFDGPIFAGDIAMGLQTSALCFKWMELAR